MQAARIGWLATSGFVAAIAAIVLANAPPLRAQVFTYQLAWQTTVSGGILDAQNDCYRLSATMGQAVVDPGISSTATYTLFTGFLPAAPSAGQDEMFFSGFENCTP